MNKVLSVIGTVLLAYVSSGSLAALAGQAADHLIRLEADVSGTTAPQLKAPLTVTADGLKKEPCGLLLQGHEITNSCNALAAERYTPIAPAGTLAVPGDLQFVVTYAGPVSHTWNWTDGSRHRITMNAAGTVVVKPQQITCDGVSFVSSTADLITTNRVWGTAIQDGPGWGTEILNFDATRKISRLPSSTDSHFTPETASYLYFETRDSVYAPPNDITIYAWEYVSSLQVVRMWVALSSPFYYPDASYEHYDFPATHVVINPATAHSCLFGTVRDAQGSAVSGAQVAFGGASRTTDAQGKFECHDIPPANYLLTITKTGYSAFSSVETVSAFSILQRSYTLGCKKLTVFGRVLDADSRQPLSGVTLGLAGQNTVTSVSGGYTFVDICLSSGSTLTASKTGYQTQQVAVTPPPDAVAYVVPDIYLVTNGAFRVTNITPKYDGLFLHGLSLQNDYTASVSWGTHSPGTVEFAVNGNVVAVVTASGSEAITGVEMADGFIGSLSAGANNVSAVAVDSHGERSTSFERTVTVLPMPANLGLVELPREQSSGNDPAYKFKVNIPPKSVPVNALVPIRWFDSVGLDLAAVAEVKYRIAGGQWDFMAGAKFGSPRLSWGGWKADIYVMPEAKGVASQALGFDVDKVGLKFRFDAKQPILTVYVFDLVPGGQILQIMDVLIVLGVDINSIQRLLVNGLFRLDADVVWGYRDWRFREATITPGGGVEALYKPNLLGSSVEMDVTGRMNFPFQLNPPMSLKVTGEVSVGIKVTQWGKVLVDNRWVFLGGQIAPSPLTASLPRGVLRAIAADGTPMAIESVVLTLNGECPRPMERDYLNLGLEQFVPAEPASMSSSAGAESLNDAFKDISRSPVRGSVVTRQAEPVGLAFDQQFGDSGWATNQVDLKLVQNVFPGASPVMGVFDKELMLLYVTDNGNSNNLQFADIRWTRWNGTNWSASAAIRTNTQAEFAPQVKYDGNGDAIAVWERVADVNFNQTNLTAMAAQMEIAWSRWNRANGTWTEPAALTANSYVDHLPLLCGPMANGDVLAVWTKNEANSLIGTNGLGADTVLWAKWSAASRSWGTSQVLVSGLAYRLSQAFAGAGSQAVYTWTRDADNVLTNDADQEVYYMIYTNNAWGPSRQLTTNAVADKTVRAAVATNGNVFLVWQSSTNLVMSKNFSAQTSRIRSDSQTAGFADYTATVGPLGHVLLLWQEMGANGSDAHYRVYDPIADVWGADDLLCQDSPLERSFAPAWDAVGNLTVAYEKVQIIYTNKTVTLEGRGSVTITNVPQSGRVDLMVTKRALVKDLELMPGDFTVYGDSFLPGNALTLSAFVHNVGNVAVSNVIMGFYDGNPDGGGVLLTNVTLSGWLVAASTSAVARAVWVVPEPAAKHTLYAVANRDARAGEFDGSNNVASVLIGGTDLSVSLLNCSVATNGALRVLAQVQNLGAPTATNSILAIRRCDAFGTPQTTFVLATAAVPVLEPGRLAQVAFDLPAGSQPAGDAFYQLKADDLVANADGNTNNNRSVFSAYRWVDTDRDGMPDDWESAHGFNLAYAADAQSDVDGDGLINRLEYVNSANPRLGDTDGDGMKDGAEVEAGTDPLSSDSLLRITHVGARTPVNALDYLPFAFQSVSQKAYIIQVAPTVTGTWLTVSAPFVSVSNRTQVLVRMLESMPRAFFRVRLSVPLSPYTYTLGFSLPDQWVGQFNWAALPLAVRNLRNAADDPDGDGMDNQSEMAAGTDPTNANSCLRLLSFKAGGVLSGDIQTATGRVYYVESLMPGQTDWRPVTGLLEGRAGATPWQVTRPPAAQSGFYRAVLGVSSEMTIIAP